MVVAGSECLVFDDMGKTCTVYSFSKSAGCLEDIKIVDVVMAYDYLYCAKTYLLLTRNALHVPEHPLKLIQPFIVCEGGITLDECPMSQSNAPTVTNHSMYCAESDHRIHFKFNNTF